VSGPGDFFTSGYLQVALFQKFMLMSVSPKETTPTLLQSKKPLSFWIVSGYSVHDKKKKSLLKYAVEGKSPKRKFTVSVVCII